MNDEEKAPAQTGQPPIDSDAEEMPIREYLRKYRPELIESLQAQQAAEEATQMQIQSLSDNIMKVGAGIKEGMDECNEQFEPYSIELLQNAISDFETLAECLTEALVMPDSTRRELCEAIRFTTQAAKSYVDHQKKRKCRTYRTKDKAGDVASIPEYISLITALPYQNALSLGETDNAYLQPVKATSDDFVFKDGKLYFEDNSQFGNRREITEAELKNLVTNEGIEDMDLPFLKALFSIILKHMEDNGYNPDSTVDIYLPELAKKLGYRKSSGKGKDAEPSNKRRETTEEILVSKIQSYHNIVGIMYNSNSERKSIFPLLLFEGYDGETNKVKFRSPYMSEVANKVFNYSMRKTKEGQIQFKKNGMPKMNPCYSYLVKMENAKERNKAAAEFVNIICVLIELAGNNTPHIKASTLIKRNPVFDARLHKVANKSALLTRTFTKTWELLPRNTILRERYRNIKLPDPRDPASIPTMATLNTLVFEFPHDGKIKPDNGN